MNMPVPYFSVASHTIGRKQSLWRQILDTVIEGRPRTAADAIAEYLTRHPYDFAPALRIDLERRHVCV